jgi:hypothetical protein
MPSIIPARRAVLVVLACLLPAVLDAQAKTRVSPAWVRATHTARREVTVLWSGVPAAERYVIRRLVQGEAGWTTVGNVAATDTTFMDAPMKRLTEPHRYSVAAVVGGTERAPTSSPIVALNRSLDEQYEDRPKESTSRCDNTATRTLCTGAPVEYVGLMPRTGLTAEVRCPTGMRLVAGGHGGELGHAMVTESRPLVGEAGEGWRIQVKPLPGAPTDRPSARFWALAACTS